MRLDEYTSYFQFLIRAKRLIKLFKTKKMKSLKNWSPVFLFLLFAALATFSSCEKEEVSTDESLSTEEATVLALTVMEESGEMGCNGCFTLVYPVTLILPDESEVLVESREDMGAAIRAYLEVNPPQGPFPFRRLRGYRPQLAFPYDIQLEDGSLMTITGPEDLRLILEACGFNPDLPAGPGHGGSHGQLYGLNQCFNLVFPVIIAFPGSNSASADNPMEIRQLITAWRILHPFSPLHPHIDFPYQVELQDGSIVTLNNVEDLADLREHCGGNVGDGHGLRCIQLDFPVEIAFPDGTITEVNSREEVIVAWMGWLEANPNAEGRPSFVYPLSVINIADGSMTIVETPMELWELRRDCW
jgi:hypothetical protein